MKMINERASTTKIVNPEENFTDLDILLEIGSMGAGHATTTLSQVLHESIKKNAKAGFG